jgi:O-antigen/teichoic acid export membrane protein
LSILRIGTIFLITGWGIQLLSGYFLNTWLARRMGPEIYGNYGVVMALLLWIEVGAISGIPTAVQKFVSSKMNDSRIILKKACQLQIVYVSLLFFVSFLCAPVIGRLFQDNHLSFYFRIALWDIWLYSFFFILMALQNGLHQFKKQAYLILVYSVSKLACVIIFVSVFNSLTGAFLANIAGSLIGLVYGIYYWRRAQLPDYTSSFRWSTLFQFAWPVAIFSLAINLFLNVDLWMVKYFVGGEVPGYYNAAATIARIPYFLFFGLSATVMPALSKKLSENDHNGAERIIRIAVRFLLISVIPLALLILSYGKEGMMVLFGEEYMASGEIVKILIWGISLLALFFLLTTILNADNRPKTTMMVTIGAILLNIVLNCILTPVYHARGAALSTTISLFVGCVVVAFIVFRRFGSIVSWISMVRLAAASSVLFVLSKLIRVEGILVFGIGSLLMVLYFVTLWITREIGKKDFTLFYNRR